MPLPLPLAPPSALDYFAALVADDDGFALLEAAASIAQDEAPGTDVQAVLDEVDRLASRLLLRLPTDAAPLARLRALNHYFFDELGFAGNVNDYQDPANSYLHLVLERRRGIPISLALIYIEIATQVGLHAEGISFPGHFLVKIHLPQGDVVLDPFTGESLSREELDERLDLVRQASAMRQAFDVPLSLFLQAASPRDIISRMLRNLHVIHRHRGDLPRLLAVLDRQVALEPADWDTRRARGDLLAQLERPQDAAADWAAYLEHTPAATDAEQLRQRIDAARGARH